MKIETPIESKGGGCLCCGGTVNILPLDSHIAAGFGAAWIEKNGETIYQDTGSDFDEEPRSLEEFEKLALEEPDLDWRAHFDLPMRSASYQRQKAGHWVLYEEGRGFA